MIGWGSDKMRKEDSVFFPRFAGKENGSSEAQHAQIVRSAHFALPLPATSSDANRATGGTVLDWDGPAV